MAKVKTFTSDLQIFKASGQLEALDKAVNEFIAQHNIETIYSVSDTTATDETGATMGIISVVAYD